IAEMIERKLRARILACLQLAHIIADAGQSLEAALAIKQVRNGRSAHSFLFDEIKQHSWIDLPRPRAHRNAVERGKAHGAFDAASASERTHRRAAAEMRDNHAS